MVNHSSDNEHDNHHLVAHCARLSLITMYICILVDI